MSLDQFNSNIDDLQRNSDDQTQVDPTLSDYDELIDNFQDTVVRLGLEDSDFGLTSIDDEFLASLEDGLEMQADFTNDLNQLISITLEELLGLSLERNTDSRTDWQRKLEQLRAFENDDSLSDFSGEISRLRAEYAREVVGSTVDSIVEISREEPTYALTHLANEEVPNLLDKVDLLGISESEILDKVKEDSEQVAETLVSKLAEEIMGGPEYMVGIDNLPFDYSSRIEEISRICTLLSGDYDDLGLSSLKDELDILKQNILTKYEEAETHHATLQESEALNFYSDSIQAESESIVLDDSLDSESKFEALAELVELARAQKQHFLTNTPTGRLTARGVCAYNRIVDTLTIRLVEDCGDRISTDQQRYIDDLVINSDLLQIYLAQRELTDLSETPEMFEYTVEGGFVPTEAFSELSPAEIEAFAQSLQEIRIQNNIDLLLQNLDVPQELKDYYQAIELVASGDFLAAQGLIFPLIENGRMQQAISSMPEQSRIFISQRLNLSLDGLDQRLIELRKACYLNELSELMGYILSAGTVQIGAGEHLAATRAGLLEQDYHVDYHIRRYMSFCRTMELIIRNGSTWEDAYDYAEQRVARVDYMASDRYDDALEDNDFHMWQFIRDYDTLYNLDPAQRRERIMTLADRLRRPGQNADGVARYGMSQRLILNEYEGEIEAYYQRNSAQIQMDIQDRIHEKRDSIMASLEAKSREEYGPEWDQLTDDDKQRILESQFQNVSRNIHNDSRHTATLARIFEQTNVGGHSVSFAVDDVSSSLAEAARIFMASETSFNRIAFLENMIEPFLITAITTAVAWPLSAYLGGAAFAGISATRMGQLGLAGRALAFSGQAVTEGLIFNLAFSTTSALTSGNINFSGCFNPRSLAVEVITDGLALSIFGGGGRITRVFQDALIRSEGFTTSARLANGLRGGAARTAGFVTEGAVLTAMGQVEGFLNGEDVSLGESAVQSLAMLLTIRSIGYGAGHHLENMGADRMIRRVDGLTSARRTVLIDSISSDFSVEASSLEGLSNSDLSSLQSFLLNEASISTSEFVVGLRETAPGISLSQALSIARSSRPELNVLEFNSDTLVQSQDGTITVLDSNGEVVNTFSSFESYYKNSTLENLEIHVREQWESMTETERQELYNNDFDSFRNGWQESVDFVLNESYAQIREIISFDGISIEQAQPLIHFIERFALNQHYDNPEQYVSHGFDHSLNVRYYMEQAMNANPEILSSMMERYGLSENNARVMLSMVAIFHDYGYPTLQSKFSKAVHTIDSALITTFPDLRQILTDLMPSEVDMEVLLNDFTRSILYHNADKVEGSFGMKVDNGTIEFLSGRLQAGDTETINFNDFFASLMWINGNQRNIDLNQDSLLSYLNENYSDAAISIDFANESLMIDVISQLKNEYGFSDQDIARFFEFSVSGEVFYGRFMDMQAPKDGALGLEFRQVSLFEDPMNFMIRLTDNCDMSRSRLSPIQATSTFRTIYELLGPLEGQIPPTGRFLEELETLSRFASRDPSATPEEIGRRLSEILENSAYQSILERYGLESFLENGSFTDRDISNFIEQYKIEVAREVLEGNRDIFEGEVRAMYDNLSQEVKQRMSFEEYYTQQLETILRLSTSVNTESIRHFGGAEVISDVSFCQCGREGMHVRVTVDRARYENYRNTTVRETSLDLFGNSIDVFVSIADYQLWRQYEAYRSLSTGGNPVRVEVFFDDGVELTNDFSNYYNNFNNERQQRDTQ